MIARRWLGPSTLLATSLALGCAGARGGEAAPPDDAAGGSGTSTDTDTGAATAADGFGPWTASLAGDHSLVGTAWSPATGETLSRAELEAKLAGARFVLLGETHDHPDHHRLQGAMIEALLAGNEAPLSVAYEMLDPADQAKIDGFAGRGDEAQVDAFAELVAWSESGWPAWELYRPAFAPVLTAGVPILAAQFPRSQTKRFMSEGLAVVPAQTVARYGLDQALEAALQSTWLDEMFASHCELVPRDALAPMVEIQRVRDALMADALLVGVDAGERARAALVAGTGHTRATGVPRLLRLAGVDPSDIVSVGFVAVDPERSEARDYASEHDVLVFTPGIERDDPCAAMRAQFETKPD